MPEEDSCLGVICGGVLLYQPILEHAGERGCKDFSMQGVLEHAMKMYCTICYKSLTNARAMNVMHRLTCGPSCSNSALARHRFFRGAVAISRHLFREVETAHIQVDFGFLKWRAHIKECSRTSRLVSLKRLQLDEAAARVELGFTLFFLSAQRAHARIIPFWLSPKQKTFIGRSKYPLASR